jgi:hypothetical protein
MKTKSAWLYVTKLGDDEEEEVDGGEDGESDDKE